jgi:tetratricopeptide (TPR) repeat protein
MVMVSSGYAEQTIYLIKKGYTNPCIHYGVLQMKAFYNVGMMDYKKKRYLKAIRFLKEALKIHDPYTPKYYYGQAAAILGIIYQNYFTVPRHNQIANAYFKKALSFDPKNKCALKQMDLLTIKK